MEILFICLLVFCTIFLFDVLNARYESFKFFRRVQGFEQHKTFYHSVISQHLRYYNRLNAEQQDKLLFRAYLFRRSKKFHYVGVEKSEEMPILISAVAVQLTFGLDKYMLNYFNDIFVLRDDYHYGFYSRPFMGHVDQTGIYLSWDNFIKGILGQTPNCNVGLHEMGHALAYVTFITETEEDKHFKKEFKNYSKVARPIFTQMQEGSKNLLGDYASCNYHEFWAVCVETFFENPVRFRHELPDLFDAMVCLLNQNPLQFVTGKATLVSKKTLQFAESSKN